MRMLAAVLPLLLLNGAYAGPPEGKKLWDFAPYSSLKRVPAERGATPNDQPVEADFEGLARALGSIRLVTGRSDEPLFIPKEANALARGLVDALAQARPGEDLTMFSTCSRESGFWHTSAAVTARMFVQQGQLNVIVHDARLDYMAHFTVEAGMPTFTFGSRTQPSDVVLKVPGLAGRRSDWVVLPLPLAAAPPTPAAAPAAVPAVIPAAVPVAAPVPAVAPAAAPAPPPPGLLDRLRRLQEARDQKLISEEDYARRKAEILKEF